MDTQITTAQIKGFDISILLQECRQFKKLNIRWNTDSGYDNIPINKLIKFVSKCIEKLTNQGTEFSQSDNIVQEYPRWMFSFLSCPYKSTLYGFIKEAAKYQQWTAHTLGCRYLANKISSGYSCQGSSYIKLGDKISIDNRTASYCLEASERCTKISSLILKKCTEKEYKKPGNMSHREYILEEMGPDSLEILVSSIIGDAFWLIGQDYRTLLIERFKEILGHNIRKVRY